MILYRILQFIGNVVVLFRLEQLLKIEPLAETRFFFELVTFFFAEEWLRSPFGKIGFPVCCTTSDESKNIETKRILVNFGLFQNEFTDFLQFLSH
jgi:hypothetical protein